MLQIIFHFLNNFLKFFIVTFSRVKSAYHPSNFQNVIDFIWISNDLQGPDYACSNNELWELKLIDSNFGKGYFSRNLNNWPMSYLVYSIVELKFNSSCEPPTNAASQAPLIMYCMTLAISKFVRHKFIFKSPYMRSRAHRQSYCKQCQPWKMVRKVLTHTKSGSTNKSLHFWRKPK